MGVSEKIGRWESDCALRYFWASTELAMGYATSIWDSACFVNVRGKGDNYTSYERLIATRSRRAVGSYLVGLLQNCTKYLRMILIHDFSVEQLDLTSILAPML